MRQVLASRTVVPEGGARAATPPPAPEEIADRFPQFEILECLGRGGMGVVYKARQKSLNRLVAIKILAPERGHESRFAERFAREAEMLAKLNHPHIVTIHDFGETAGLFYLVMEFVDGVNLRDLLRDGKLEAKQALAIVPPICDALQYAHDKGIVHRDIKPENLLLDREGRIKIADFGIAALMGTDVDPSGTPPYMAPEQCGASPEVDNRADIYALGVVLYEMLTGERPNKELIAPSKKVHIDVRLDEIVLRALERTPELRFQTAGEFRTQVETIASTSANFGAKEAQIHTSEIDNQSSGVSSRFSRTTIVGACWALAAVLHYLMPTLGYRMKSEFVPLTMSILGLSAPIGTTILGWIAVWQIRRSAGSIHGLRLAVFDGLLFPLLAFTALIGWFWHWVFNDLMRDSIVIGEFQLSTLQRLLIGGITPFTVLATLLTSLVAGFFIIRRVWRKVNQPVAGLHNSEQSKSASGPTPASETKPASLGKWAVGFFIGAVVGFPVLWGVMGAQEVIVLCGLALLLSLVFGAMSWRLKSGKFAALTSGLGLLLLIAFTSNYLSPSPPRGPYEGGGKTTAYTPVKNNLSAALSARYGAKETRFELGKPIDLDLVFLNHSPIDIVINPQELPPTAWLTVTNSVGERVELKGTNQAASVFKEPRVVKSRDGTGGYAMSLLLLPKDDTTTAKNAKADAMAWVEPGTYTLQFHLRLPPTSYRPDGSSNKEYHSVTLTIEVAGTPTTNISVMPSNSFGPVIERELILGEKEELRGLYLESGNLTTLTEEEYNRGLVEIGNGRKSGPRPVDWFDSKQLDIAIFDRGYDFRIAGREGRFVLNALPAEKWDTATYTEVSYAVASDTVTKLKSKRQSALTLVSSDGHWAYLKIPSDAELPLTYAMRCEDKLGLLQITARVQNPEGIKLRYKLVQNEVAGTPTMEKAAKPSVSFGPVVEHVQFTFNHPEALVGGHELTLPTTDRLPRRVPRNGQPLVLTNNRRVLAQVRLLESSSTTLKAEAACSEEFTDWETQVISLSVNAPKGKLRFKNGTEATVELLGTGITASSEPPNFSFGSVVERELRVDEEDWLGHGLDFESGKVLTLSREEFNRIADDGTDRRLYHSEYDFVKAKGVDMFFMAGDKGFGLGGPVTEFKLSPLPVAAWYTATESQLNEALEHAAMDGDKFLNGFLIPTNAELPLTYALRSGDKLGLLQITAVVQNPNGIKLRYKLVQPAQAVKQTPQPEYEISVQFGSEADAPVVKADVQLGTQFSHFLNAGERLLSISGQIDPPKNGKFPGTVIAGDWNLSEKYKGSGQQGGIPVELELGKPFSHTVIMSIARTCIITLNKKPASTAPKGEPQAEKSAWVETTEQMPSFGPVVERLVPRLAAGRACLLDFETGQFQTPPDDLAEKMKRNTTEKSEFTKSSLRWLRESLVDIAASPDSDTIHFLGSIARKSWGKGDRPLGFDDFTPALVVEALSGPLMEAERKPGIYSSIVPADFGALVFITAQGNMGVLEITAGANDPAGVRIRYKLLQGVKPGAEAMAAAKVVLDLPPLEPVKELKIPQQDFPEGAGREGYRLTVEPGEGDYVLAALREYEGSEVVGEETPVKRQVTRLLRTQSVNHSEDIFLDSQRASRPIREGEADRFVVSGFGQQVAITDLDFSGGSAFTGQIGDDKQPRFAKKRFKFSDTEGDKTRTRIVEFELRVIRADESAALAKHHGISLPDENVANWAITLSAESAKEGEKAGP